MDPTRKALMKPTIVLVHGAFADSASWDDIVGLVYVNGFAPEPGENCFGLAGMFPGSMVGEDTVQAVPRCDGTTDLYIARDSFHDVFCADLAAPEAARLATTQRPVTEEAL